MLFDNSLLSSGDDGGDELSRRRWWWSWYTKRFTAEYVDIALILFNRFLFNVER